MGVMRNPVEWTFVGGVSEPSVRPPLLGVMLVLLLLLLPVDGRCWVPVPRELEGSERGRWFGPWGWSLARLAGGYRSK